MSASKRMGRPPLAEGAARAIIFTLRLSPDERDEVLAAAARDGIGARRWAREVLLAAARSPWRVKIDR